MNWKQKSKWLAAVCGAALCTMALYVLNREGAVVPDHEASHTTGGVEGVRRPESVPYPGIAAQRSAVHNLQQAWIDVAATPGVITEAHRQLAQRSVDELLCGRDLVELIGFLQNHRFTGLDEPFDSAIVNAFASSRWAEACEALTELPRVDPFRAFSERWSFLAGQVLPEARREMLLARLKSPGSRQNVILGLGLAKMASEPVAAVALACEQLKLGMQTIESSNILTVLTSEIPADADFEALERALVIPNDDVYPHIKDSLKTARHNVMRKWAEEVPEEAASYILANSERMEPELMGTVVEAVVQKDPVAGVEWLQDLPHGPFLDQAISYTIATIAQTDAGYGPAKELAELISDAVLREERLAWIEARRTIIR